ncbi:hypothetical protein CGK62_22020, partial [Vibrio parahaemolyticus]
KYVGAFILLLLTGIEYQLAKHINHGSC